MVKLSVIIVNYNVKYFLEQALVSVQNALKGIESEIFVVDNCSNDGSKEMVQERFKDVILIVNQKNLGFSKANNIAVKQSNGEYILLLNPDTVVEEDTFEKVIEYMDQNPEAGSLGVKMIDGKGNFLPESKRSLPTPKIAFYKAFGLSSLFPKSKEFGKYHLGYLDEDEVNEVEVLAGAFMLLRKSVLDLTGLLDEDYFMYGEDIDLSYRINKAGFKNIYYPQTRIIHYKGESTKKGSLNYVKMFYNAMVIFSRKHFGKSRANLFSLIINTAIYLKAVLHLISDIFSSIYLLMIDALLMYGGIYLIKDFWAKNVKDSPDYYPVEFIAVIVPSYILIWVITVFFSGGYDRSYKISKAIRGIFFGTIIILAVYGFIGESYRYSRAIIFIGAVWAVIEIILTRFFIHFLKHRNWNVEGVQKKNSLIVGNIPEGERVLSLLKQSNVDSEFIGFVTPGTENQNNNSVLGDLQELEDIIEVFDVDEIIYCAKDVPAQKIIHSIVGIGNSKEFKIVPEASLSIIGSNSKNTAGDLYAIDMNFAIETAMSRRNKRVLDLILCGAVLVSLPISIFIVRNAAGLLLNWFRILIGNRTWVGYAPAPVNGNGNQRPSIKSGILNPVDALGKKTINDFDPKTLNRLNLQYAKDYSTSRDLEIFRKGFREIGRTN